MFGIDDAIAIPAIAGLAGSALSFIGGQQRNDSQIAMARETNQFNAEQADINRKFQEQMSNTAYQRRALDLQAAGLNPILATMSAASVPVGGQAIGTMPQINDVVTPAVQTGLNTVNTAMSAQQQEAQTLKLKEEVKKVQKEVFQLGQLSNLTQAQMQQTVQMIMNLEQTFKVDTETLKSKTYDNVQAKIMADFFTSAEWARVVKEMGPIANVVKYFFFRNRK